MHSFSEYPVIPVCKFFSRSWVFALSYNGCHREDIGWHPAWEGQDSRDPTATPSREAVELLWRCIQELKAWEGLQTRLPGGIKHSAMQNRPQMLLQAKSYFNLPS